MMLNILMIWCMGKTWWGCWIVLCWQRHGQSIDEHFVDSWWDHIHLMDRMVTWWRRFWGLQMMNKLLILHTSRMMIRETTWCIEMDRTVICWTMLDEDLMIEESQICVDRINLLTVTANRWDGLISGQLDMLDILKQWEQHEGSVFGATIETAWWHRQYYGVYAD